MDLYADMPELLPSLTELGLDADMLELSPSLIHEAHEAYRLTGGSRKAKAPAAKEPAVRAVSGIPMNVQDEETTKISSGGTIESAIPMNVEGEGTIEVSNGGTTAAFGLTVVEALHDRP